MISKCQISKRVFLSQAVKTIKIKEKLSMRESSWGVTIIYVEVNQWVNAFDRKICKITVTRLSFK